MEIRYLNIHVEPSRFKHPNSNRIELVVEIEVKAFVENRNYNYKKTEVIYSDDFESLFERMVRYAAQEIRDLVLEKQHENEKQEEKGR